MTPGGDPPAPAAPVFDVNQLLPIEQAASDLVRVAQASGQNDRSAFIVDRLTRSVLRPLRSILGDRGSGQALDPATASARELEDRIWELARDATELRRLPGAPCELIEAAATLQDLATRSGRDDVSAKLVELRSMLAGLSSQIQVARDGPYLVANAERLTTWLGEPIEAAPQIAVCRCGRSAMKPFCDGSHSEVGFSGDKDPNRVPDRRDTHVGQQAVIYDNRGICAHSGFCTDRLSSVFRLGEEPFVAPSGGRLDEIVTAVRNCPSGALSFGIDGVEAREYVDQHRPPGIEVSKNGPYRVTGGLALLSEDGTDVPRAEGASREHYSLCRCGHSRNKPFCSGMHWYVGFSDPTTDPARDPTLFEWAGGYPALLRMTRIFYGKYVPQDPLIGPLFAHMAPDHPERVASWLSEVFGGPKFYSARYGDYNRMISQHLNKGLTEPQRSRWASLMVQSAVDAGLPNDAEFRAAFTAYLEWGSHLALENSQPGATPPQNMPIPRWWWVCDATPGARVSALAAAGTPEGPLESPAPGEAVTFDRHIRGLFRAKDRGSMKFAFDLWSRDDVRLHASAILERLRAGTMPCDGRWPPERVQIFDRWIAGGCQ
jgi:CDGSH-type Zn-finger protein/truncated hemoglobin YjbI